MSQLEDVLCYQSFPISPVASAIINKVSSISFMAT
jgi:hypothetical protein